MKIDKKKIIKIIFRISFILIFLLSIIPIPINRVYDAVEIKIDDPSYLVPRTIKIDGKYHWNILIDDMFKGKIIVSDYSITNGEMSEIYFDFEYGGFPVYSGYPLEYYMNTTENGREYYESISMGRIFSKSWF